MANNDVSFILSFVILMAKIWIFGFTPGVCPTEPSNLVFSFGCLGSNGRQALLGGIRLGGSTIIVDSPICEVCHSQDDTSEHIILRCGIGFSWPSNQSIGKLFQATRSNNIPEDQFGTLNALCCWQI